MKDTSSPQAQPPPPVVPSSPEGTLASLWAAFARREGINVLNSTALIRRWCRSKQITSVEKVSSDNANNMQTAMWRPTMSVATFFRNFEITGAYQLDFSITVHRKGCRPITVEKTVLLNQDQDQTKDA